MRHPDIFSATKKMSRFKLLNLVDSAVSSIISIREALGLSKALDEVQFIASCRAIASKASKYDQLIKDLGVEMRDPNGTIWDEAKRLRAENDKLVHCLRMIRDNPDQGGYWCAEQATWALRAVTPESMDSHQ